MMFSKPRSFKETKNQTSLTHRRQKKFRQEYALLLTNTRYTLDPHCSCSEIVPTTQIFYEPYMHLMPQAEQQMST
jgi:hypothetical protein